MTNLTQADLDALTAWDTPTICNALELTSPERRATGFTVDAHGLSSAHETLVAYTSDQAHSSVEKAVRMIMDGAKLIATNLDPNCPTEHGLRPGCGAIVAMLEKATGTQAFSVGKPSPVMMRMARKELDLRTAEATVVGDTMETDILGGVQMGYRTVLVLSGGTQREDLKKYAYQPDLVVNSIADLIPELENTPQAALSGATN